jgi:hypothetical protein
VQAVIEIDNGVTPQPGSKFLSADSLTRPLQECREQPKGKLLNLHPPASFFQVTCSEIDTKCIELDNPLRRRFQHGSN